jgi:uncharacterized protein YndB with AHSA1/START domain
MEKKTKVHAEDGRHDLTITREFDLPLELLFKAYAEPDLVAEWMETTVLKLESKKHGSYQFQKSDEQGNVYFRMNGTIHEFIPNQKIIRTFEMENTPVGVQLEVYEFEPVTDDTSRVNVHVIYETVAQRDQVLKMPFAQGINMAHNRIEKLMQTVKQ